MKPHNKKLLVMKILIGVQLTISIAMVLFLFGLCGWAIYKTPQLIRECEARDGRPFLIFCTDKNLTKGILK